MTAMEQADHTKAQGATNSHASFSNTITHKKVWVEKGIKQNNQLPEKGTGQSNQGLEKEGEGRMDAEGGLAHVHGTGSMGRQGIETIKVNREREASPSQAGTKLSTKHANKPTNNEGEAAQADPTTTSNIEDAVSSDKPPDLSGSTKFTGYPKTEDKSTSVQLEKDKLGEEQPDSLLLSL
ncbi:unnamed protein product [Linum trigynum]